MNLRNNAPAEGGVVDAGESSSRKKLLVGGGLAAALAVVAAMSYVFLAGSDNAGDTGVVASAGHSATSRPTTEPTGTATSAPAIKKFTGKNAKDPFKPLVVEQAASTGAATVAGGSPAAPAGTPVPGVTPSTSTSVSPAVSPTTTPATPAPQAKSMKITMVAVSTGDTTARITVDSKTYDVKPLGEFGSYFKLLNLRESKCGAIQYGDATFDLCEGQSRLVR